MWVFEKRQRACGKKKNVFEVRILEGGNSESPPASPAVFIAGA